MVDHVDKIWDGLDEYKEVIEGLNDTHDSLASNSTNEVMKTLTIIATLMMPTTLVASIYGMNIPLPFQDSPLSLLIVILIMVAIIGVMLLFFRRKHLI
jgi:magnesium transporter